MVAWIGQIVPPLIPVIHQIVAPLIPVVHQNVPPLVPVVTWYRRRSRGRESKVAIAVRLTS